MGIVGRFSKRAQQTPDEIPSGAYEDYLQTKLTRQPSYQDIEGPKTLVDVPPERDKEFVQQEKIPLGEPEGSAQYNKLGFDPTALDKRIYEYIRQVALPKMREMEQVLFYVQKAVEGGVFKSSDEGSAAQFDDDVDYMLSLIDDIMMYLAGQAADAFDKLDKADQLYDVDFDEIDKIWQSERQDYKDWLQQVGDPFAEQGSPNDPFQSQVQTPELSGEYGDVPGQQPESFTEDDLWEGVQRKRDKEKERQKMKGK